MFVLQRAEEPLDHAVGLWAPHPCADVTKQRVVAGQRVSEGHATKAWPVVGHDGDRSGCCTDHVVVGVDDVHHAAVGTEVVQVQDPFGPWTAPRRRQPSASGPRDGGGQAVLGGVVDDCADPPDPAAGGLELGEVHLPDPVPLAWWVLEHPLPQPRPRSAVCPEPGRQQQSPPAEGPLNGGGGHLVASADRKSTRLNSSHEWISYAVFCLKKKRSRDATRAWSACHSSTSTGFA